MDMNMSLLALALGFLLDALLGDPHSIPHPVRWMGRLIGAMEHIVRKRASGSPRGLRRGGVATVVVVTTAFTLLPLLLLGLAYLLSSWAGLALESLMCWQILAARSLRDESMRVYHRQQKGDLAGSREAVARIVGRETAALTHEEVTKAAVETVAENTCDGVVAPLFFLALGGPVLGFFYKAVNTMDSMLGYKNERYIDLGRCAARLDDVVNFIPARMSALLIIVSARLLGMDAKNAWKIFRRDRFRHKSPNSAQTESACAGALGVQLAGDAYYFGQLYNKPTLGDASRPVVPRDIVLANRLMYSSAGLMLLLCLLFRGVLFCLWSPLLGKLL